MSGSDRIKFRYSFLILFGLCVSGSFYLLFVARNRHLATWQKLNQTTEELDRLQGLAVSPNERNLAMKRMQVAEYAATAGELKRKIKSRVLPAPRMQPNEFQARLRETVTTVTERARASRVEMPASFFLGFDRFASALPDNSAASRLGQELAQVELLANILIDARINILKTFHLQRASGTGDSVDGPRSKTTGSSRSASRNSGEILARSFVDLTFVSTPAAARQVLNRIVSNHDQFYVIRLLHVVSEKDKGPSRTEVGEGQGVGEPAARPEAEAGTGLHPAFRFIVGTERIQTTAAIEIVSVNF